MGGFLLPIFDGLHNTLGNLQFFLKDGDVGLEIMGVGTVDLHAVLFFSVSSISTTLLNHTDELGLPLGEFLLSIAQFNNHTGQILVEGPVLLDQSLDLLPLALDGRFHGTPALVGQVQFPFQLVNLPPCVGEVVLEGLVEIGQRFGPASLLGQHTGEGGLDAVMVEALFHGNLGRGGGDGNIVRGGTGRRQGGSPGGRGDRSLVLAEDPLELVGQLGDLALTLGELLGQLLHELLLVMDALLEGANLGLELGLEVGVLLLQAGNEAVEVGQHPVHLGDEGFVGLLDEEEELDEGEGGTGPRGWEGGQKGREVGPDVGVDVHNVGIGTLSASITIHITGMSIISGSGGIRLASWRIGNATRASTTTNAAADRIFLNRRQFEDGIASITAGADGGVEGGIGPGRAGRVGRAAGELAGDGQSGRFGGILRDGPGNVAVCATAGSGSSVCSLGNATSAALDDELVELFAHVGHVVIGITATTRSMCRFQGGLGELGGVSTIATLVDDIIPAIERGGGWIGRIGQVRPTDAGAQLERLTSQVFNDYVLVIVGD